MAQQLGFDLPVREALGRDDFLVAPSNAVALSMVDDAPDVIHGIVTMGNFWIFGVLDRPRKTITQDIGGYRVPDDIESLIRVLIHILES